MDLAREALAISRAGLASRGARDAQGHDEGVYLDLLDERVAFGRTQADNWLGLYDGEWGGDLSRIYEAAAY
jgi:glutamate--cysteine ligase